MTSEQPPATGSAPATSRTPATKGALGRFAEGFGLFFRGLATWATSPRSMLLGLIPSLITFILYAVALVTVVALIPQITDALTWFAAGWADIWRTLLRVAVGAGVIGVTVLVAIYTFTVVTLAIGGPFFEAISRTVDDTLGQVTEVEQSFWPSLGRGILEAVGVIALTVVIGVGLFLMGFIPVIGTIAAAVIGALSGSWFLALELSAAPLQRRGHRLGGRWRILAAGRARTLGFGLAVFLTFLIPLGALLLMPSAVAGATLLARASTGEAVRRDTPGIADH